MVFHRNNQYHDIFFKSCDLILKLLMNNRKKMFIFTTAYQEIGSGHLFRSKILQKILSKLRYKREKINFRSEDK